MQFSDSVKFATKGSVINVDLSYIRSADEVKLNENDSILLVGQPKDLRKFNQNVLTNSLAQLKIPEAWLKESLSYVSSEDKDQPKGSSVSWTNRLIVNKIDDNYSRHNTPSRAHSLSKIVKDNCFGDNQLVIVVCERKNSIANACAIARTYPLYTTKTDEFKKRNVHVAFVFTDSDVDQATYKLSNDEINCFKSLSDSVRLAAKITDIPCMAMNTNNFLDEIKIVAKELNIEPVVIEGEDLNRQGFGGIYNVGKCALYSPKLVVLSHLPQTASRTIAWVGKGIVYDTGGLSLKSPTNMLTMKIDCGGAAGILGAFYSAVKLGFKDNLHAVFCLAENMIGPNAVKPDDIIKLYSGKSIEITNTDAEGRLVLGDGVAYAKKDLKADIIVDMATLTGAQQIATGKYHAAIVTNNESWEEASKQAGRKSGDLCFPLVFAPEFHLKEFDSDIADMRNSVLKVGNASSSCAGLFIYAQLGSKYNGVWVHIDMAAPVTNGERGTGYGVALLNTLFSDSSENSTIKLVGGRETPLPIKTESDE